ncbi:lipopolysaccharide biosynthesis protein [Hoeflea sp. TYP-13]|uniref:lipopolysaccharide biosynthesis protein n=1 Tax=Hoeflea sp. TYP-13 TaxID=3230023 RepID=UPI0034C67846
MPHNWVEFVKRNIRILRGYFWALSGSAGRLVISLAYFIAIANTLSIADFGIFATTSAMGIVLSRITALGFSSPLYRAATVKPRLIGAYSAGYMFALAISVPVVALAALISYFLVFAADITLGTFAVIVLSEALLWRSAEIVMIVCNGMGRFARAAVLVVIGSSVRAAAALLFAYLGDTSLAQWAWFYFAANAIVMAIALSVFYPRYKLRWSPALYLRRWRDSLSVAGAEILFYLQSELDKLLVLSIGGPVTAGLYAIIMRLVDLTALPIRTFNMMLVQGIMRSRDTIASMKTRAMIEGGIALISTAALLFFAGFLTIYPEALGKNVAEAAPLLILVVAVPALRNLIEYQSELLYATGRTFIRTINMTLIGLSKAAMLSGLLVSYSDVSQWAPLLNGVFLLLYLLSALLTYPALRKSAGRII